MIWVGLLAGQNIINFGSMESKIVTEFEDT